ncbi:MAG: MlaD family protein [Verrucomicrobia bacterium]|nr:MlaD family protein [Verrucomicrobiota bacterium]
MSGPMEEEETPQIAQPEVRLSRRLSVVWVVPVLALLLGGWLVFRHFSEQGPLVRVDFKTAEGIVKGKTEVRCRSVRVGVVESVRLADDLNSVKVMIRMDPEAEELIRERSRFWVVRPRVSGASISGLGTIISGAYIELEPGVGAFVEDDAKFEGLEEPPVTAVGVPGLRLTLVATEGGKADVSAPVLYLGNRVGRVERTFFDPETGLVQLSLFIEQDYAGLVTENTRFWIANAIEMEVGAQGFKLKMPSLSSVVSGGVTFGVPKGVQPGGPISGDPVFQLFDDEAKAAESVFESAGEMLLFFNQSVRGLQVGAAVEFRGLEVGRVLAISFFHAPESGGRLVPVVIQFNKQQIEENFPAGLSDEGGEGFAKAIRSGLRGSLKSSNLLTGQLFVELDYYDDEESGEIVMKDNMVVLPTVESGIQLLEGKVVNLLAKLEALDVEGLLTKIGDAAQAGKVALENSEEVLKEARDALAAVRTVVEDEEFARLPEEVRLTLTELRGTLEGMGPDSRGYGDMRRTMDELRSAARSIERVADTIEKKPNSLIFGKGGREVIPKAVRVKE